MATYVNIDDVEIDVAYMTDSSCTEGVEGYYYAHVSKELMEQMLYDIGYRKVPGSDL